MTTKLKIALILIVLILGLAGSVMAEAFASKVFDYFAHTESSAYSFGAVGY